MKHRTVNSVLGFVVPLVLTAVLILGWRAPLFLPSGGEMVYFLLAIAMGYPALGVFCGIMGVRSGFVGKWLTVPFVAALGVMMALSPSGMASAQTAQTARVSGRGTALRKTRNSAGKTSRRSAVAM